jgi:hypothetical protein
LNGKVYRKDDPARAAIYPPNGFNCRCRTRVLTEGQLAREGRRVEAAETVSREVRAGMDPLTGEVWYATQTGVRYRDPISGQDKVMWVDVGFNASPAASHLMDDLLLRKARSALGQAQAMRIVRETLDSEPRQRAWQAFVDNTLATGRRQNQTMTLGLTPTGVVAWVVDTLLVGPKARRHAVRGEALGREEWMALTGRFRQARWYEDRQTGNLVALMGDIVAYIDRGGKVDSLYRDPLIGQKIATQRWTEVK